MYQDHHLEAPANYLPCVEIEPATDATAAVIWMHGLGADGHDFEPIVPHLRIPETEPVRFIFPHAPSIPVTINNGMVMPAWYDILNLNFDRSADETQLRTSATAVGLLIEREIKRGLDSRRIIIVGFSQGGAVGYELALTYPFRLGGLIAISSYFATQNSIEPNNVNQDLPILICHGQQDPMIPEIHAQTSYRRLLEMSYNVEYKAYPVQHNVDLQEVAEIGVWITDRLRNSEKHP